MDKPFLSVHERRATKQTKTKKKLPVKVVYISNPMKVKTTASEFRALVQELTGRDASSPDNPSGRHQMVPDGIIRGPTQDQAPQVPRMEPPTTASEVPDFVPYDDVYMSQMLENLTGFLPSNYLFESAHVDVLRSLDAV